MNGMTSHIAYIEHNAIFVLIVAVDSIHADGNEAMRVVQTDEA